MYDPCECCGRTDLDTGHGLCGFGFMCEWCLGDALTGEETDQHLNRHDPFFVVPEGWAEHHPDRSYETLHLEIGERAVICFGYDAQLIDWFLREAS